MADERATLKGIQTILRIKADATLLAIEARKGGYDLIFRLPEVRARWHAIVQELLRSAANDPLSFAFDLSQQYRLKDGKLAIAGRFFLEVTPEQRGSALEELRLRLNALPTPGRARIMKAHLGDVSWMRPMSNGSGVYRTSLFNPQAVLAGLLNQKVSQ